MTTLQKCITVVAVVLGTALTRFLPLSKLGEPETPGQVFCRLGSVLPYAVIGFLVVYSLKDVAVSPFHGLPEIISILFIAVLHKWRKNTLLSIGAGTALYMYLVQVWFR